MVRTRKTPQGEEAIFELPGGGEVRFGYTKDPDMFQLQKVQRDNKKVRKVLEASFDLHGFIAGCPLHCNFAKNGKYLVKQGQGRYRVSIDKDEVIWYVVCHDTASVAELELSYTRWNLNDFLDAYVRGGNQPMQIIKDIMGKYDLKPTVLIKMLNDDPELTDREVVANFKQGDFIIGDVGPAERAGELIVFVRENLGITRLANRFAFQLAIHRVSRLPQVDLELLMQRIRVYNKEMKHDLKLWGHIEQLQEIYNKRTAIGKQLSIKLLAEQDARIRAKASK